MREITVRHQKGFTLIELVIVIIIMGILAAVLIPKLVGVTSKAKIAATSNIAGVLKIAISLSRSQYAVADDPNATTVAFRDGSVATVQTGTAYGLPTPDAAGIGSIIQDSEGYVISYGSRTVTFTLTDGSSNCCVYYDSATGLVTKDISGC
jgi:MSHA pilin protein MshA